MRLAILGAATAMLSAVRSCAGYWVDTGPVRLRGRRLVATHFYFDPEAGRLAERLARGYRGPITIATDGLLPPACCPVPAAVPRAAPARASLRAARARAPP